MKKRIYQLIISNLLLKGSLVVLIGAALANFGAYLFHLLMGRILGPQDYGVLESLISLAYFLNVPISVLSLVVVKFVSKESDNKEKISLFVKTLSQKLSGWGFLCLVLFLAAFPFLKNLLRLDSFGLFLGVSLFAYLGIFLALCAASLQGMAQFAKLSLFSIFGSWSKLLMALLLVFLGFRVGGAVYALVLATGLSILLGYKFLTEKFDLKVKGKINIRESFEKLGQYSLAVFVSNLSLTSFYTVDIILARYFLPSLEAGFYAALSVLGKVIFFASFPIVQVMFPLVSKGQAKGEDYYRTIELSFVLVLGASFLIALIYFLFPGLMINLLFGKDYLKIVPNLGAFAIFISLYSLCSLLINFYLSISKTKVIIFLALIAVLQIVLIACYHQTIGQIVKANILTMTLLLTGLLVYYFRIKRAKIRTSQSLNIPSLSKV
ncbi:MAG TPA: oligosaccharide flippase family protein [Clostridia bacterium]|nr:oligosaccharide flippase family protein [Clostridia bacterium]